MKPPRMILPNPTPHSQKLHDEQVSKVLSNITFGSTMNNNDAEINIDHWKASGTTPGVADTEFTVAHSMGRIPITFIGSETNNGGVIYRSTTAWTATQVFLKCTKATAAFKLVLI